MLECFSGDHNTYLVTLTQDGSPVNVSSGTVRAALIDVHTREIIGQASQSNSGGADWANGLVLAIVYDSTSLISEGHTYFLEVETIVGGQTRTYRSREITGRKGYIV